MFGKVFRKTSSKNSVNADHDKQHETSPSTTVPKPRESIDKYPNTIRRLQEFEPIRRDQYRAKLQAAYAFRLGYLEVLTNSREEMKKAHRTVTHMAQAHAKMAHLLSDGGTNTTSTSNDKNSPVAKLRESNRKMKEVLVQNADIMDDTIAQSILEWQTAVEEKRQQLENYSGKLLNNLQLLEKKVSHSWSMYSSIVKWFGKDPSEIIEGEEKPILDTWLCELAYRSLVTKQQEAWEEGFQGLENMFQSIKDLECLRRIQFRETTVLFLEKQQELFGDIAGASNSAVSPWEEKEILPESIADEINDLVMEKLESEQLEMEDDDDDPLRKYEEIFDTGSILSSEFAHHCTVLDIVLESDSGSNLQCCFTVLTSDGYIHLFVLPDNLTEHVRDIQSAVTVLFADDHGQRCPDRTIKISEASISEEEMKKISVKVADETITLLPYSSSDKDKILHVITQS